MDDRRPRTLATIAVLAICTLLAACGVQAAGDASSPRTATNAGATSTTATSPPDPTVTTSAPTTSTSTTTTTAPHAPLTPEQQQGFDVVLRTYSRLGLDEAKSRCIAFGLLDAKASGADVAEVQKVIIACGVTTGELLEINRNAGIQTPEDGLGYGLEVSLEESGLSKADATCIAGAYVAQYGTDISKAQDEAAMRNLFTACGVQPG